jgi:hypothetical protein
VVTAEGESYEQKFSDPLFVRARAGIFLTDSDYILTDRGKNSR